MEVYDPARDGFTHARLVMVASRLGQTISARTAELAYGAWNSDFCSADAALEAVMFFAELRATLWHFMRQAEEACAAQGIAVPAGIETTKIDSTEGKSPVAKPCAPSAPKQSGV